jgi:micrococcal nuclease
VPQWLIWLILVVVALAIIWFFWNRSQENKAAAERAEAERRRAATAAAARTPVAPSRPTAPVEPPAARAEARLQDAADTALATDLPEETARIEAATADLAKARREAEAAAERLSEQADEVIAEVRQAGEQPANPDEPIEVETVLISERRNAVNQAAVPADGDDVPPGAVRGDGGRDCPPVYPIKANTQSMLYHTTASHSYSRTIPELCFTTTSAAEAAGFSPARDV